ncbi:MAG: three-Cys-motif partner protein TcmP [Phycisphaeraceae bacterium]|nr:three-Cys-motif partner protein TcmP [Phycisphaeraceae bacterium]
MAQLEWSRLCERYTTDDHRPTRSVGGWTEDKLFFWHRYVQITATAMVGNPRFPGGVAYVDLFAGPGVCVVRDTLKRLPGSPLIAAYAPKPLSRIIACELDKANAAACEERLAETPAADRCVVLAGDCNTQVDRVIHELPKSCLGLAFIDPEALHVKFETIRALSAVGAMDLLVLFADAFDVVRNVEEYYLKNPQSPLDRFLGEGSDWRTDWSSLLDRSASKVRDLFLNVYRRQLKRIGYSHFGDQQISGPSGPLYRLVYASKSALGLKFWEEAKSKTRDGQSRLW